MVVRTFPFAGERIVFKQLTRESGILSHCRRDRKVDRILSFYLSPKFYCISGYTFSLTILEFDQAGIHAPAGDNSTCPLVERDAFRVIAPGVVVGIGHAF
jgi:hypothetical protein